MVGTSDERLMNLHDALKLEFQKVQRTYQDSLEKLDALALVVGKVGVEPPIPAVSASPDIGMVGVEPSNSPA